MEREKGGRQRKRMIEMDAECNVRRREMRRETNARDYDDRIKGKGEK